MVGIDSAGVEVRQMEVCGRSIRVATRPSTGPLPPLLIMNGSRCSLDVLAPLLEALDPSTGFVCFDPPGIGGSPRPRRPYRLSEISWMVNRLLQELDVPSADVLGVFGIFWNLSALLAWGLAAATGNGAWHALFGGMGIAFLWILVSSIFGARAAWRGRPWRYPGAIRFVPGGWPPSSRTKLPTLN